MKYQDLFSSEKKKKSKLSPALVVIGTLRVKVFLYLGHMYVKITTKCHNRKVQLSRGIKRRRDEQIKKKMPDMKPYMHKELQQRNHLAMVRRKTTGGWRGRGALTSFTCSKPHP